jgi:hypothetical protein
MSERFNPMDMLMSQEMSFDMDAMGAIGSGMLGISRWTENDELNAIYNQ